MELSEILTYIGTALGGGGVVQFFNWRTNRKKAVAEVEASEIENIRKTMEQVYQPLLEQLSKRVSELQVEVEEVRVENRQLRGENEELRRELADLRTKAMFRNTNRSRDGKFAPAKPTKDGYQTKEKSTKDNYQK